MRSLLLSLVLAVALPLFAGGGGVAWGEEEGKAPEEDLRWATENIKIPNSPEAFTVNFLMAMGKAPVEYQPLFIETMYMMHYVIKRSQGTLEPFAKDTEEEILNHVMGFLYFSAQKTGTFSLLSVFALKKEIKQERPEYYNEFYTLYAPTLREGLMEHYKLGQYSDESGILERLGNTKKMADDLMQ